MCNRAYPFTPKIDTCRSAPRPTQPAPLPRTVARVKLAFAFAFAVTGFAAIATILFSAAASAHRYRLDFHRGEYYLECKDPHWRDR